MRRHGILRHRECLGDVAGREPFRLVLRQQAKHVEARRLRKGGERQDGLFRFHISRLIDILLPVNAEEGEVAAHISILLEIRLTGLDWRESMST